MGMGQQPTTEIVKPTLQQTLQLDRERKPRIAHIIRKINSQRWFRDFLENYLSHHFRASWGEHHYDLMECVQSEKKDKRIARCEPREHGKSTFMDLGACAWWLATKRKNYIVILGAAGDALWNHYSSLQTELDPEIGNERLLSDFPHLLPLKDFKNQFVSWNDSKSKIRSGAVFEARSSHAKIRGLKEGKWRPDVMIFDDPQDDEDVSTDYRRNQFLYRFQTTLINLIGPGGDIYVIGNLLHNDSFIGTILRDKAWDGKLYRAENLPQDDHDKGWPIGNTKQDGSALWEAAWPLERLHKRKKEIRNRAYAIEFLNRMTAAEEVIYDSALFNYFSVEEQEFDDAYTFVLFWDPSDPKKKRFEEHDPASITVGATKKVQMNKDDIGTRYWWIVHNYLKQSPIEYQVEEFLRCLKTYPVKMAFYEDNGGFGVIRPYLRTRAKELKINIGMLKMVPTTENKIQKIYNMEPTIKKRVFFADHLSTMYLAQWDEFPHGTHDDGPDSTVSMIEQYERFGRGFMIAS
jgi:hypothetical protein